MVDIHWADYTASDIIKKRGDKKQYTVAAGITPSGTVHIGNFREIITVDLVKKALEKQGKKVRFVYSWDDYDRLRKIPKNFPKQELLTKHLGRPIVNTPDVFGCHKSYAEHLEKELEESLPSTGIKPEFIYQSKMYRACKYAEEIKYILNKKEGIKKILDKYRKEPLPEKWIPLSVYCEKCDSDHTRILEYDEGYRIKYKCECGFSNEIDFRKKGIVKLPWRIDWPMRQKYEKVDFEPAGKEHYQQPGGSRITANEIFTFLYSDMKHPTDLKYDFIIVKGVGGKMSSSLGNVITLKDCLEVYEPEIIRYLFVGTKPNREFAISFDLDVMKIYEDFDFTERVFFDKEKISNDKERKKLKGIYEYSSIKIPKEMPEQPSFRHMTVLSQIHEGNIEKATSGYKSKRVKERARCAWNWIQKYAPEEMKFKVHDDVPGEIKKRLNEEQKNSIGLLIEVLKKDRKYSENGLFNEFYRIIEETGIKNTEFFRGVYLVLIGKEKGPKLASFILILGKKRVLNLLKQIF